MSPLRAARLRRGRGRQGSTRHCRERRPLGDLARQVDGERRRQGGVADQAGERPAEDVLHDDGVALPVAGDQVVDLDDGRVVQARHGPRLAAEALGGTFCRPRLPAQTLDRHPPLQALVEGEENLAHATAPEASLQAVGSDALGGEIPVVHVVGREIVAENYSPAAGSAARGGLPPDAGKLRPDAEIVVPDAGISIPDANRSRPDTKFRRPDAGTAFPDAGDRFFPPGGSSRPLGNRAQRPETQN